MSSRFRTGLLDRFRIGLLEWITAHLIPNFILGWKFRVPTMVESIVFENGQIIQIHVPPERRGKEPLLSTPSKSTLPITSRFLLRLPSFKEPS